MNQKVDLIRLKPWLCTANAFLRHFANVSDFYINPVSVLLVMFVGSLLEKLKIKSPNHLR